MTPTTGQAQSHLPVSVSFILTRGMQAPLVAEVLDIGSLAAPPEAQRVLFAGVNCDAVGVSELAPQVAPHRPVEGFFIFPKAKVPKHAPGLHVDEVGLVLGDVPGVLVVDEHLDGVPVVFLGLSLECHSEPSCVPVVLVDHFPLAFFLEFGGVVSDAPDLELRAREGKGG